MALFKKILKIVFAILLAMVLLFCVLPYAFPVNERALGPGEKPFANSQFMTSENVTLHYRVFEPATDSCIGNILLIHGFCGSTFSWRKNADTFAAHGYRVVAVDIPGYGFSDRTQSINHAATYNARLLWPLLDSIDPGKWIITGHSMGAGTALAMASSRPLSTERVILVDGAFSGKGGNGSAGVAGSFMTSGPVKRWAEVLGKAFFFNQHKITELLNSAYSAPADSVSAAGYLQPLMLKNTASSIMDMAGSKEVADINLQVINMPVLAVWGKNDTWVPYARFEKYLKVPNLKIKLIDGAGHCPMETHSEIFNKEVLDFIGQ